MKGTPVKSAKQLKSGFEPFQKIVEPGTDGEIIQAGKDAFGEIVIVVKFEGYGARVTCKRDEIEATG